MLPQKVSHLLPQFEIGNQDQIGLTCISLTLPATPSLRGEVPGGGLCADDQNVSALESNLSRRSLVMTIGAHQ